MKLINIFFNFSGLHTSSVRPAHWHPDGAWFKENYGDRDLYMSKEEYDVLLSRDFIEVGESNKGTPVDEVPIYERYVKNTQLNFGPQHPAAHGVLRLVLQLDGEVWNNDIIL